MKLVNLKIEAPGEEVLAFISDNRRVNSNVKFDEKRGTPLMHVKEKSEKITVTCEMINRPTKDNGFLVGTYFKGTLKEKDGITTLKGAIVTAPIYHIVWFSLLCVLIWQCFYHAAISAVPILFVAFEVIMYSQEFRKQGYIKRYFERAFSRLYREKNAQKR